MSKSTLNVMLTLLTVFRGDNNWYSNAGSPRTATALSKCNYWKIELYAQYNASRRKLWIVDYDDVESSSLRRVPRAPFYLFLLHFSTYAQVTTMESKMSSPAGKTSKTGFCLVSRFRWCLAIGVTVIEPVFLSSWSWGDKWANIFSACGDSSQLADSTYKTVRLSQQMCVVCSFIVSGCRMTVFHETRLTDPTDFLWASNSSTRLLFRGIVAWSS